MMSVKVPVQAKIFIPPAFTCDDINHCGLSEVNPLSLSLSRPTPP